ncbi:Uncharacterised protein [Mycobacteroides abscessus subsp. abscessus]|nr:Uncharacterised protein [Mycobacteroides abscessus subsp. abscessus]
MPMTKASSSMAVPVPIRARRCCSPTKAFERSVRAVPMTATSSSSHSSRVSSTGRRKLASSRSASRARETMSLCTGVSSASIVSASGGSAGSAIWASL